MTIVVPVSGRSLPPEVKVDDACQSDMPSDVFPSFLVFAGSFLQSTYAFGPVTVTMVAALEVLAGKLKPNLGRFDNPPDWQATLESCFGFQNVGEMQTGDDHGILEGGFKDFLIFNFQLG